jgi:hypothetical protein
MSGVYNQCCVLKEVVGYKLYICTGNESLHEAGNDDRVSVSKLYT